MTFRLATKPLAPRGWFSSLRIDKVAEINQQTGAFMAKSSRKKAAKSKRAAAKPKRVAAKPTRAAAKSTHKVGASLPVVRLVTPADPADKKHPSQDSFEKLLKKLVGSVDYKVCYGKYDTTTLTAAADGAVTDAYNAVDGGQLAVIVAAGTMAATIVQDITIKKNLTATIPIILAVGGSVPTNRQQNLTGFIIDAVGTAQAQLALMNRPVAVLFDDTPGGPSNNVYSQLDQTKVTPLTARNPSALKTISLPAGVNGFMLLPNAMFYNHCDDVVKIVDGKTLPGGGPLPIYYPESEYWAAHKNKNWVKVLGHHVSLTYRLAATFVDSILSGDLQIPLPEPTGAVPDKN
jgi:hypothetical protein